MQRRGADIHVHGQRKFQDLRAAITWALLAVYHLCMSGEVPSLEAFMKAFSLEDEAEARRAPAIAGNPARAGVRPAEGSTLWRGVFQVSRYTADVGPQMVEASPPSPRVLDMFVPSFLASRTPSTGKAKSAALGAPLGANGAPAPPWEVGLWMMWMALD